MGKRNTKILRSKNKTKGMSSLKLILREILYPNVIGIILTIISFLLYFTIGSMMSSPCFSGPSIFANLGIFLSPIILLMKAFNISQLSMPFILISSVFLFYFFINLIIYLCKLTFHKKKVYFVLFLFLLIFLLGIDEPIINSLFNKPDFDCNTDSDCVLKHLNGYCSGCRPGTCVNKDWNYYYAPIKDVYASCLLVKLNCTCEENTCVTNEVP